MNRELREILQENVLAPGNQLSMEEKKRDVWKVISCLGVWENNEDIVRDKNVIRERGAGSVDKVMGSALNILSLK